MISLRGWIPEFLLSALAERPALASPLVLLETSVPRIRVSSVTMSPHHVLLFRSSTRGIVNSPSKPHNFLKARPPISPPPLPSWCVAPLVRGSHLSSYAPQLRREVLRPASLLLYFPAPPPFLCPKGVHSLPLAPSSPTECSVLAFTRHSLEP